MRIYGKDAQGQGMMPCPLRLSFCRCISQKQICLTSYSISAFPVLLHCPAKANGLQPRRKPLNELHIRRHVAGNAVGRRLGNVLAVRWQGTGDRARHERRRRLPQSVRPFGLCRKSPRSPATAFRTLPEVPP